MKGDFSRITFDPAKQYRKVLQQQGRVALDADQNEQADIEAYLEETALYDVIGDSGAPYHWQGPDHGDGFKIFAKPPNAETDPVGAVNMLIGHGRYYVHGKLAENPEDVTLASQFDVGGFADGRYIAYLDLWDRLISSVEDPDIREIALGGPDTATRIKAQWRIRLKNTDPGTVCTDLASNWDPDPRTLPTMCVVTVPTDPGSDPCQLPVTGGYQGLENQLYRAEIHALGPAKVKWSRDNASLAAAITQVDNVGKVLTLTSLGMDPARTLDQSPILEIVTEADIAARRSGLILTNFQRIAEDRIQVLDATVSGADLAARNGGVIRAWDGMADAIGGKADIPLESGISIQFDKIDFRVGDYWIFDARALTNIVQWPAGVFQPPMGEMHYYAVLAILDKAAKKWTRVSDCRHLFTPLTEEIRMTYVCGDGQEAMPGFQLFQPLTVAVFNGLWPEVNVKVRFTVIAGDATISANDVLTDGQGLASVTATLQTTDSSVVEARLIDTDGNPTDAPIRFNLNLSKATLVEYTPGSCPALADKNTVQDAVDRLRSLRRLAYEGGDGQTVTFTADAPDVLAQPLQVRVSSLCGPAEGEKVTFTGSGGLLSEDAGMGSPQNPLTVQTNANGLAVCYWKPDADPQSQTCLAHLDDAEVVEQQCQVQFNAEVLHADDILFKSNCPWLDGAQDVQAAIDALCPKSHLFLMGGTGQVSDANGNLAEPIVVRVLAGGSFPVKGVEIKFELESGEGVATPDSAVTDDDGLATCQWQLGSNNPEQVLSVESSIGEKVFATASRPVGGSKQGIRVRAVKVGGRALQNDQPVMVQEVMKGIEVELDAPLIPELINGKFIGDVTIEAPCGNSESTSTIVWQSQSLGNTNVFQWLTIAGSWTLGGENILQWKPTDGALSWLKNVDNVLSQRPQLTVPIWLTLRGWTIAGKGQSGLIYLDGITFALPEGGHNSLKFGQVSGLPGSRFEMWMNLVHALAQ